jgi:hypothetical protein
LNPFLIHGAELPQQVLATDKFITVQMNTYFVRNSKCLTSTQERFKGEFKIRGVRERSPQNLRSTNVGEMNLYPVRNSMLLAESIIPPKETLGSTL